MACCKRKRINTPIARLCPVYLKDTLTLVNNCSDWQDENCDENLRQARWEIWINFQLVQTFNWAFLDTPIPIGNESTYAGLQLPNGEESIFDYLENEGFVCTKGDRVGIRIWVKNCHGISSIYPSSAVEIIKTAACPNAWLTLSGEPFGTLAGECWTHL